jgi:hypothetical protein
MNEWLYALLQAKRQNAEFVDMLDKHEAYQHVQKRKGEREGGAQDKDKEKEEKDKEGGKRKRSFRQLKGSEELKGKTGGGVGGAVVQAIFSSSSSGETHKKKKK